MLSDPQGHDIKLIGSTTSLALTFTIVLQNLTTNSHRTSGESKYDRKLPELDVVTKRIRYGVNGVLKSPFISSELNIPGVIFFMPFCCS